MLRDTARWRLTSNPAAAAAKRKEPPAARLEVFTVEQIEQLARVAQSGAWRDPQQQTIENAPIHAAEDAQLAELLRVAAYTGLRRGELVTLRWRDVDWSDRVLTVERGLSADVEGTTKGRKVRYVPLGDQALGALDRLSRRPNFTGANDYVFANAAGDRIDGSALRRRYIAVRDLAGAPSAALPRPPPHRGHAPHPRPRPGDRPRRPRPLGPQDHRALPPRGPRLATRRRRDPGLHARVGSRS